MKRDSRGVSLIALVITIIVLGLLTSVVLNFGKEAIKEAKLQNLKTDMLLIEAKAKEFVENANFDLGIKPQEASDEMKAKSGSELEGNGKGTKVVEGDEIISALEGMGIEPTDISNGNVYKLSTDDLQSMGINDVMSNDENGWFIIVYNITDATVKVYNTLGIKIDGEMKYSLESIKDME